jgi:hypothetical protein
MVGCGGNCRRTSALIDESNAKIQKNRNFCNSDLQILTRFAVIFTLGNNSSARAKFSEFLTNASVYMERRSRSCFPTTSVSVTDTPHSA